MSESAEILPHVAQVLREQDAYRAAPPAVLPRALRSITAPFGAVAERLIPPEVVEAAILGADWLADASIRRAAMAHDPAVLEACDAAAEGIRRRAIGFGASGGGAAGAFGAAGLVFDMPATITLALRTARLTGLAYGFHAENRAERTYILDILQLAGANSQEERSQAIRRLAEGRTELARGDWQRIVEMTGHASGSGAATRRVAVILGVNLSTRKMAQLAPVIGAAVGASVNAAFQADVARAAQFAFRARWLEVNEGIVEGDSHSGGGPA